METLHANLCSGAVPGGQECDVDIAFTPTATGTRSGTLTFAFGGNIPAVVVSLTGTGTAPAVTLAPTSLSFGDQANGTTSPAHQVTITNSGTGPLTISSLQTTSEFAETNTCGAPVAPNGGACTVQVTFTPGASGSQTGTLTIADNAQNSPQTVALAGNQPANFSLAPNGSSSMSAMVAPGQTATYALSVSGTNSFSGTVSFTCTGAPASSTCSVSPNPVNISGASSVTATVSVSTVAATSINPFLLRWPQLLHLLKPLSLALIASAFMIALFPKRRCAWTLRAIFAGLLLAACAGCGGGSSSSTHSTGTPAGQYTIAVTATSGSITQNMSMTLTVN